MPLYDPNAPVANAEPQAPIIPQQQTTSAYPKLKYQFSDQYPGFVYVKVESAEEEKELLDREYLPDPPPPDPPPGSATAGHAAPRHPSEELPPGTVVPPPPRPRGWYDSPDEARYARAMVRAPYKEYGRDVAEPMFWPVSTNPALKLAAEVGMMDDLQKRAADAAAKTHDDKYPRLKYQPIEEPPGFAYRKVNTPQEESDLAAAGGEPWFDTPAEAIKSKPADQQPQQPQGQRPAQTSLGSQPGPALPEGAGGPLVPGMSVPDAHTDDEDPPPDPHAKKDAGHKNGEKNGKHKK